VNAADVLAWIERSRVTQGLPSTPTTEEIARIVAIVAPGADITSIEADDLAAEVAS
jgi:hypothetical protein